MGHVETGVAQELLELGIFRSVFVHDEGGGESKLVGGAIFNIQFLTAFL
ncbi:MAG: hypothetical protein RIN55_12540 [Tissierellaceae bacterium]|nr:hypothetical protein [Tissierellaceae bacterium]